jgi:hypothetical protein
MSYAAYYRWNCSQKLFILFTYWPLPPAELCRLDLNHVWIIGSSLKSVILKRSKLYEFITVVNIHSSSDTVNSVWALWSYMCMNEPSDITVSWCSTESWLYLELIIEYFDCQLAHRFLSKEYKLSTLKWKTSFMLCAVDSISLLWLSFACARRC